ncbi:hypothetical protein AYI68_g914, partial [Smittium mucronatum]
MSINPTFG